MTITLERPKTTISRKACSKAKHYGDINKGLWTKQFKIGDRASAQTSAETDAQLEARIAGKSDEEIRELVRKLEAARIGMVI